MSKTSPNIYIIDGHALCYRAFYALPDLRTSKGMPTNAIYGFITVLRKLIREYKPEMMAVIFDSKGPTTRHKKYKDYKINRKPMPGELVDQMPKIKEVVEAFKISICEVQGYEADDVIATLTKKAEKQGLSVTIVTGDKDALQLVDEKVKVLSPHTSGDKIYDLEEVKNKYGVSPEHMVELMALAGDVSDNIPGVKGIGEVTASKLLSQFKTVDAIYESIEKVPQEVLKKKLIEGKEMAHLSRELAALDFKVPVDIDFNNTKIGTPDMAKLTQLYKDLEFEKFLKEITPTKIVKGEYSLINDSNTIEEVLKKIKLCKQISLSVTLPLEGIAFSWERGKGYFIPFKGSEGSAPMGPSARCGSSHRGTPLTTLQENIETILSDERIKKIGYDLKNILLTLRRNNIEIKGEMFDVMIADYLVDPARMKYGLEDIALRHLGSNLSQEVLGELYIHECEKADAALELYEKLEPILKERQLDSLFKDVEMPLVEVLRDMEYEGVSVDSGYLSAESERIGRELESLSEKIYDLAGQKFNINSPKQLQTILYEKLALPITKKTKTGASTDESVLRKLAAQNELASYLLKYREMNKLKTAYYDSIQELINKKTGKLYAHFNQAVTITGRLSSSEPNLQNIPIKTSLGEKIRKAFIPGEKGESIVSADYSQIELRILAHLSQDKCLLEAFEKEEDIHRATASLVFSVPFDKVTTKMRSIAKTVNFGIIYGMTSFGLAKELDISAQEAQEFIDSYFDRYSSVRIFIEKTIAEAKENGYVRTLLGRRRLVPEIASTNERLRSFAERVAINTPIQGSAADIIKLAMLACHKAFIDTDVKMLIQVHDELVFEVPEKWLKEYARKIEGLMEHVVQLSVPLKVNVVAGKNWLEMREVRV